ncbi:MAG: TetR/AcrR family transcriptional regulator [Bryobacterales bacterium]|jgi:AcrR family transcriptional regulator|nr:TetR/AcrR family transcriptional regulator [Bryobacterales bacterium]
MGIHERRNREKQLLRQEILDAAREMFVRDGYEGVSMRKIAEKIEYSPTTIYHYFRDKTDLLSQIIQESFTKLNNQLEAVFGDQSQCPRECLRRGMATYVDFALTHPSHYYLTFMFRQVEDCPSPLDDEAYCLGMKCFDYLRQAVKRAMDSGEIDRCDLETASQALWAGLHGVSSLLISLEGGFPFVERQQLINHTLEMMLRGAGMQPKLAAGQEASRAR